MKIQKQSSSNDEVILDMDKEKESEEETKED